MNRTAELEYPQATSAQTITMWDRSAHWYGRICLLLVSTALLTASFAPVNQFYLAWVGLVPWFIVLDGTRSQKSAFVWSWLAGTFFFIANMWWMYYVTSYGMVALMAILGLYWGYAGVIIRGAGLLGKSKMGDGGSKKESGESEPIAGAEKSSILYLLSSILHLRFSPVIRILLIAAIWVTASEWFRGTWPWHGLPWLYLGSTQTPALWMCQIADITGVAGLSFLIVTINAWLAIWLLNRMSFRKLKVSGIYVALMLVSVIAYGVYRLHTEPRMLVPGPTVMVVQSNFPQDNSGAKGATANDLVGFHFRETIKALRDAHAVDLCVWSETMMPPLNEEARSEKTNPPPDEDERQRRQFYADVHSDISYLTRESKISLLTGGESVIFNTGLNKSDRRNSAYFYDSKGHQYPERYDKIHLVPYGEFIPFKDSMPWLYKLAVHFGPPDMEAYSLVPGNEQHLTVFPLKNPVGEKAWRFVTPVCFEDIDADICADMCRPESNSPDLKRADFLVNITNDGWFKANENPQHLQAAIFRSIENRTPTARSVNTGISGFIDPLGRPYGLVTAHTSGTSTQQLQIDPRVTVFTRAGPVFSWFCAGVTFVLVVLSLIGWLVNRIVRTRATQSAI